MRAYNVVHLLFVALTLPISPSLTPTVHGTSADQRQVEDSQPPRIISYSPMDGAFSVLEEITVSFTFSESIDTSAVAIGLAIESEVLPIRHEWSDNNTVVQIDLESESALQPDTRIFALLSHLTDTAGNRSVELRPSFRIRSPAEGRTSGEVSVLADLTPAYPGGICADAAGNVFVGDIRNRKVLKVDLDGNITHVAGTGEYGTAGDGGLAREAQLSPSAGVFVDRLGDLYIAEEPQDQGG